MRYLALALLVACSHPRPAPAPAAGPTKTGAQIMILGVYHFDNPGLDVVKSELDDHLSERRQAEIAAVAAQLEAFHPTQVLVESASQDKLDAAFASDAPLTVSEVQQLGFRIARDQRLPGVSAVDVPMEMDFDRLLAAAQASHDPFLDIFQRATEAIGAQMATLPSHTVGENLRMLNDPGRFGADRDLYLTMARVKNADDFAGADVLASWVQRNFRIFANIAAHATSPEDRILVIFGQGHAAFLRELVAAQPDMVLVEPNDYLR